MSKTMTQVEYEKRVRFVHKKHITVTGKYIKTSTPIKHKCKCGHTWKAAPTNITHKTNPTGCPKCSHPGRKKTTRDVLKELKWNAPGFKMLGVYTSANIRVLFKCPEGHEFSALPRYVISKHRGCNVCGSKSRYDALSLGIVGLKKKLKSKYPTLTLLSKEYINNTTKYRFKCSKGHTFESHISRLFAHGSSLLTGCSRCDNLPSQSLVATQCIDVIAKTFRLKFEHARNSKEYRIPGTRYSVDGYNARYDISLEFHGDYWHGVNFNPKTIQRYINTLRRDKIIRTKTNLITVWEYEWKNNPSKVLKRVARNIDAIKLLRQ